MNAEQLHDALSGLSEDMLTQVDALRRKKHMSWKSLTAVAACLFLVAGLWFFFPGDITATDSATGSGIPEVGNTVEDSSHSTTTAGLVVQVVQVDRDCLWVKCEQPEVSDICIQTAPVKLTFENLKQQPRVHAGQNLRIFFEKADYDAKNNVIRPYKIEIIEK